MWIPFFLIPKGKKKLENSALNFHSIGCWLDSFPSQFWVPHPSPTRAPSRLAVNRRRSSVSFYSLPPTPGPGITSWRPLLSSYSPPLSSPLSVWPYPQQNLLFLPLSHCPGREQQDGATRLRFSLSQSVNHPLLPLSLSLSFCRRDQRWRGAPCRSSAAVLG